MLFIDNQKMDQCASNHGLCSLQMTKKVIDARNVVEELINYSI